MPKQKLVSKNNYITFCNWAREQIALAPSSNVVERSLAEQDVDAKLQFCYQMFEHYVDRLPSRHHVIVTTSVTLERAIDNSFSKVTGESFDLLSALMRASKLLGPRNAKGQMSFKRDVWDQYVFKYNMKHPRTPMEWKVYGARNHNVPGIPKHVRLYFIRRGKVLVNERGHHVPPIQWNYLAIDTRDDPNHDGKAASTQTTRNHNVTCQQQLPNEQERSEQIPIYQQQIHSSIVEVGGPKDDGIVLAKHDDTEEKRNVNINSTSHGCVTLADEHLDFDVRVEGKRPNRQIGQPSIHVHHQENFNEGHKMKCLLTAQILGYNNEKCMEERKQILLTAARLVAYDEGFQKPLSCANTLILWMEEWTNVVLDGKSAIAR